MSGIEELRRLLDERGVAHSDHYFSTTWRDGCGMLHLAGEPMADGSLVVDMLTPEQAVIATLGGEINGDTSDGYHTFNELYHHRAVLFSVIVSEFSSMAWKARKHHDGTMYDGMFIVGLDTPWGQASYHYDIDPYWDMFDCEERESAPEWDGHTPDEAIERIGKLATLGGGKLTAEQVRNAAKSNSRQYESPVDDGVWIREYDWQAIADELNAELGKEVSDGEQLARNAR